MLGPSCGTWSIHLAALHTGPPSICVGMVLVIPVMALLVGDQFRNIAAYRLAMIGRSTTILAGRIATISSVWCAPKPKEGRRGTGQHTLPRIATVVKEPLMCRSQVEITPKVAAKETWLLSKNAKHCVKSLKIVKLWSSSTISVAQERMLMWHNARQETECIRLTPLSEGLPLASAVSSHHPVELFHCTTPLLQQSWRFDRRFVVASTTVVLAGRFGIDIPHM